MAKVVELELYFEVRKTGHNELHFTVVLPHPVTEDVAERFNQLFGRLEKQHG